MAERNRDDPGKTASDSGEDFLSRWSRRKREATREEHPAPEADSGDPPAPEEAPAEEGPTDADLPPVESLGPDSDYSQYLSGRVSEHLRRAALRKLFGQPAFNVRDGLDDYDEDYRSFAALGDTITADMHHHRERLREKASRAEAEAEAAKQDHTDAEQGPHPADPDATDPGDDAPGELGADRSTDSETDPETDPGAHPGPDTEADHE